MELCRHKNYRNADYLSWLRTQKCLVSGGTAECAHHVRLGTNGGKGLKPSDYFCIPLTHDFHTKGPKALHLIGEKTFLNSYKIEIVFVFIDQLRRYLIDKYQFKSNQMFDDPLVEIESLVSEIEMRRPVECLKKKKIKAKPAKKDLAPKVKKLIPSPPKASEAEFYQKAKELKRAKDKELRASLKEKKNLGEPIRLKKKVASNPSSQLSKDNEFYQKAKEFRKAKEKELREKNKAKQSQIRKELYQKSKALKKEREKVLRD